MTSNDKRTLRVIVDAGVGSDGLLMRSHTNEIVTMDFADMVRRISGPLPVNADPVGSGG